MLVDLLENGWKRYKHGCIWRCAKPGYLVEQSIEGNVPSFKDTAITAKIRRIQNFYNGRLALGQLDAFGTGLDILVANAMAESSGTVPTRLEYNDLKRRFMESNNGASIGDRLSSIVNYIEMIHPTLVRKEKKLGYSNPIAKPGALSLGAHHLLLSTALELLPPSNLSKDDKISELVLRLPSQSLFAAELAIKYLNNRHSKHQNDPPLTAAIYNAGSIGYMSSNKWNLRSTDNHIDNWIKYYNTSRLLRLSATIANEKVKNVVSPETFSHPSKLITELKLVRKEFQPKRTFGELFVNEQFQCFTLEDVVRLDGFKIKHETAIPKGRYKIVIKRSPRFKKDLPVVLDVPGFSGILIHPGNTEADTSGCILVGRNKESTRITESRVAFEPLFLKIKDSVQKGDCYLTIA